jgi:hypothetical protein
MNSTDRGDLDLVPALSVNARSSGRKLGDLGDLGLHRCLAGLVAKTGDQPRPIDQHGKEKLVDEVAVADGGRRLR